MPLVERMQHESIIAANMDDLVTCPGCDARFIVSPSDPYYTCDCGRLQCRYCHRVYDRVHNGKTCEEVERLERKARIEHDM